MPSSVAEAKKRLRAWLRTVPGLTEADKVLIRGAPAAIDEVKASQKLLILGDVTAPQTLAGLARRAETPTMTCWVEATVAGGGDEAEDAARDQVYGLLALVERAVREDPSGGGAVPPPGQLVVGASTLEEVPAELSDRVAARRAQLTFQLTWTSHIT